MLVPTLVVLLCLPVVLVGAGAQLLDAARRARMPAGSPAATAAPDGPAGVGRWSMAAWFGVSAVAVLGTASVAGRRPEIADVTLVVLLLGLAADGAFYLVRRRRAGEAPALPGEVLALVTGALGVVVGLSI